MDLEDWWAPSALKQLKKLPREARTRLLKKANELKAGPVLALTNAKKLHGVSPPKYSIHVGDYRLVYEIDAGGMVVVDVGDRKDVYRSKY